MSKMTNYTENQLRDHFFRTGTFPKPAALYFGLMTVITDGETSAITEVTGGSYARAQLNPADANYQGVTDGYTENLAVVTFPVPTADWGQSVAVGLFDALSGGNMLFYDDTITPKTVNNGDPAPKIPVAAFTATFA